MSVNSNGGVLHPVVHKHPISGRKSIYLHLGMTGAVLELKPDEKEKQDQIRLLTQREMETLFNRYPTACFVSFLHHCPFITHIPLDLDSIDITTF